MKRLVALGFAALVVAGCSNDEASAPPTAPVSVAASVADTTVVTTTSPPRSTSSTTITPTTLPATTTTTVATEDLIEQAVQDYFTAYHVCGAAPEACVPESFTAMKGRSRSTITELATGMAEQGLYFLADTRGSYVVVESVTFPSSSESSAIYCVFDALTVMGPIGPDGVPTVVNDQILSLKNDYRLFLEDGSWRVGEQLKTEDLGVGSQCPPAE